MTNGNHDSTHQQTCGDETVLPLSLQRLTTRHCHIHPWDKQFVLIWCAGPRDTNAPLGPGMFQSVQPRDLCNLPRNQARDSLTFLTLCYQEQSLEGAAKMRQLNLHKRSDLVWPVSVCLFKARRWKQKRFLLLGSERFGTAAWSNQI